MRHVAILVAASPTAAFYSQIATLVLALRQLRWRTWTYRLHVFVGGTREPGAFDHWEPHLSDVTIHWTSEDAYARDGDWAQSDDVFRHAPSEADVLLALDADTLPVASLEPILDQVAAGDFVAGVIAHYPTMMPLDPTLAPMSTAEAWRRLAHGIVAPPPDLTYSHSLLPAAAPADVRAAPFYLNFGVVYFSRSAFDRVAPAYLAIRPQLVDRLQEPDFSGQAGLTLAVAQQCATPLALGLRENFPNDITAEQLHPEELERVVIYHYLRTDVFDRHEILRSAAAYRRFLSSPMSGVNARFREAVRRIVGEPYPFV